MKEWVSVYEKNPPLNTKLIIKTHDQEYEAVLLRINVPLINKDKSIKNGFYWIDSNTNEKLDIDFNEVTHWMELPELPE